jgi:hypothetical protein
LIRQSDFEVRNPPEIPGLIKNYLRGKKTKPHTRKDSWWVFRYHLMIGSGGSQGGNDHQEVSISNIIIDP